jgi:outer membrane protein OmpA-like peptidoglycan-associated protein
MKNNILLIIGLLYSFSAIGQQDKYQWRLGVQSGIMSYRGDINNEWLSPNEKLNNLGDNNDYLSYGISLEKSLSRAWGFRLLFTNGEFIANDRAVDWNSDLQLNAKNFGRALNVKTELSDWSLLLTYSLDNGVILSENAFLAPYLTVGLGYTDFQTYGDLLGVENGRYYYWDDGTVRDAVQSPGGEGVIIEQDGVFETKLSDLQTEGKDYNTYLFHGTAGLGLKFRLGSRFNLNLETLLRFTNTDYLDDVSDKEYLANYENEFQQYAAIPGTRVGDRRGNDNGKNDIYTFTSIGLHFNFGRKKETVRVPIIRIGPLSNLGLEALDTTMNNRVTVEDTSMIMAPAPVDTQAIFVVKQSIDSAYLVQALDSVQLGLVVDTLLVIGDSIKLLSDNSDSSVIATNELMLQEYLELQGNSLDSLNTDLSSTLDSQYYFIVADQIDSIFVLRDSQMINEGWSTDNLQIDTFYQVGDTILQNDLDTLITEEDWLILRNGLLNPGDSIGMDQSYEDYLQSRIVEPDTMSSVLNPEKDTVLLDSTVEPPMENTAKVDSLDTQLVSELEEGNVQAESVDSVMAQMLVKLERELDSLKRMNNAEQQPLATTENKAITTVSPVSDTNSQELIQLRERVAQLEQQTQQRDKDELEKVRQELAKYQAAEKSRLEEENARLQAEIRSLRDGNANQQQPPPKIVVPPSSKTPADANNAELNQLRSDVAAMNKNMELMRQLLVQQQVIASLNKNQPEATTIPANSTPDSMALELTKLREEVAELRSASSEKDTTRQQPLVVTMPVKGDKADVDSLKTQLLEVQQQLELLKNAKPAEPVVERVVVEVPVEKPVDIAEAIKGKDEQIIFFAIGSSKLSTAALTQLQAITQLMKEYPTVQLKLDAFTDASGDATRNMALSKRRAESVKAALLQSGISETRIQMNFKGEDAQSDPAFGRRVEMKVYLPN